MPRGKNQRGKLLYLQRFLTEYTDAGHPATMEQILEYLERNDIAAERKGIYEDLEYLRTCGTDVQSVRVGRSTGYYLGRRDFEPSELRLLVDAVQSSRFLTESKSMSLISRLEQLGSRYQAKQLRRHVWVRGRVRTMNESVFSNVDRINTAIESDCRIMFRYYTWNEKKERVLRRGGARYTVSPWALLLDDENYYLLAYEDGVMKHFRVDKMLEIRVTDREREGKDEFRRLNMAAYTDSHFGMFSGESERVKLCFENGLAGVAVDQFGKGAMLIPCDSGHFTVTANVTVSVQFFGWVAGFGDRVRILEPQSAVDGMRAHLSAILRRYPASPFGAVLDAYDSIVFVDTETTGFDAEKDSVTEFAAIRVRADGSLATECFFVRLPEGVSIPEEVVRMTGITDEMCAAGISRREMYDRFRALLDRRTLIIAYNAQFDATFLRRLAEECGGSLAGADYLDALTVYRERAEGPHRLSDAIAHYGTAGRNSHRALEDAQALMEVTRAMVTERDDLLSYVNLFGYREKYGVNGRRIEGVRYYPHFEGEKTE